MASTPTLEPRSVAILVLEGDSANAVALRQILDSEGWLVRIVPDTKLLLTELKTGEYSLVVANAALVAVDSAAAITLRELASVPAEEGGRVRVLYVVPEMTAAQVFAALELARLPYVVRPFHLNDFLEKVSDLLVEIKAIGESLRQVRHEFGKLRKKKKEAGRSNSMFAARDGYSSYTEEELAEYERAESEASKNRRRGPKIDLGGLDR